MRCRPLPDCRPIRACSDYAGINACTQSGGWGRIRASESDQESAAQTFGNASVIQKMQARNISHLVRMTLISRNLDGAERAAKQVVSLR